MDSAAIVHLKTAPQSVRRAVAAAAKELGPIDLFELVTGARYGIEEQAGKVPPPDETDRRTLGPFFFRGRELVLKAH